MEGAAVNEILSPEQSGFEIVEKQVNLLDEHLELEEIEEPLSEQKVNSNLGNDDKPQIIDEKPVKSIPNEPAYLRWSFPKPITK